MPPLYSSSSLCPFLFLNDQQRLNSSSRNMRRVVDMLGGNDDLLPSGDPNALLLFFSDFSGSSI